MMLIFTLFIIVAAIGTIATLVVGRKKVEQTETSQGTAYRSKGKVSLGKSIIIGVVTAILYIIVLGVAALISAKTFDAFIYIVFAYFGWKTLNRIQSAMFVWMPLIGWVIYFVVKFILSAIIGAFVAPVVIGKGIYNKVESLV